VEAGYERDLLEVEFHFLDSGRFALADKVDEMVSPAFGAMHT
jgi:hypothetical protein